MMNKILILALLTQLTFAKTIVNVGAYLFPPYFIKNDDKSFSGIVPEYISILNSLSREFEFKIQETSPKRRYQDFVKKEYDAIFFESNDWGWGGYSSQIDFVGNGFLDGEVFIANKENTQNDEYFSDLSDKSLGLYLGYHYKFANFNADEEYLKKNFKAYLSSSHERNILSIIGKRLDIAIVTKSFIYNYLNLNPNYKKEIYISKSLDQQYDLKFGLRKDLSHKNEIEKLLLSSIKTKEFIELLKKYQIDFGI